MDKNYSNKLTKLIKKEGFYFILFLCLSIIATVMVIKSKQPVSSTTVEKAIVAQPTASAKPTHNNSTTKENSTSTKNVNSSDKNTSDNSSKSTDSKTAQGSTKTTNSSTAATENANSTTKGSSVSVNSNTATTSFKKPVTGVVVRHYSEIPVAVDSTGMNWSSHLSIDIKADKGSAVVAAMAGVVEEIGYDSDGEYIVINHQNGIKTVYSNLDEGITVKLKQKVEKGEAIGKVGDTSLNGKYLQPVCSFLSFKVLKGNVTVDPEKYVKY